MKIMVVFRPDDQLPDPTDPAGGSVQRGLFLDDGADCLLVYRERLEDGTSRDVYLGQGIFEDAAVTLA